MMIDTSAYLGNAQDAVLAGLQKRITAQTDAAQRTSGDGQPRDSRNMQQVREAAQEFEAFFIGQMMEQMMSGIEADPLFGGGEGEDMWRSMLSQEYGKEVAKNGGLGIADQVMGAMLKAQEERTAAQQALADYQAAQAPQSSETSDTVQDSAAALVATAQSVRRQD